MPRPDLSEVRRRLELGRLLAGSLLEMAIKAYGLGAVLAVVLSDAETAGGKASDAVRAVPSLAEEWDQARYVVDHREEIQAAVTYLNENTIPQEELERTADESVATLDDLSTTYDEVGQGIEALKVDGLDDFPDVGAAYGHLQNAFSARPDLSSIRELAGVADQVGPLVDQVDVLLPVYYGGLATVADNFASDEILSTVIVMALAYGVAVVVGQAVGFWVRRGRPGLFAILLQALGARIFRRWYVDNLPFALTPPLYDAAREHLQAEIVADPEAALDPETLRALEEHFADPDRARR